jgi:hypothetical protein
VKESYSGLTKSKSKQSARDLNSLSGINCAIQEQPKERAAKVSTEVDANNPQIIKLNSIFNSLFGKRSKLQLKTYTEGMLVASFPKENTAELPDISHFKDRVELEIERYSSFHAEPSRSLRIRAALPRAGSCPIGKPQHNPTSTFRGRMTRRWLTKQMHWLTRSDTAKRITATSNFTNDFIIFAGLL